MGEIEYSFTDEQGLEEIESLWFELNEHHRIYSQFFSASYPQNTFSQRKKKLLEKSADGALRIDLARDKDTGELVGYSVGTISKDNKGELDSIFVEEYYRRSGIGDYLVKQAMSWMRGKSVNRIVVEIIVGNEDALRFYGRYGFYPRSSILERTYPVDPSDA